MCFAGFNLLKKCWEKLSGVWENPLWNTLITLIWIIYPLKQMEFCSNLPHTWKTWEILKSANLWIFIRIARNRNLINGCELISSTTERDIHNVSISTSWAHRRNKKNFTHPIWNWKKHHELARQTINTEINQKLMIIGNHFVFAFFKFYFFSLRFADVCILSMFNRIFVL